LSNIGKLEKRWGGDNIGEYFGTICAIRVYIIYTLCVYRCVFCSSGIVYDWDGGGFCIFDHRYVAIVKGAPGVGGERKRDCGKIEVNEGAVRLFSFTCFEVR
jgi:hypothetical protein